MSEPSKYNFPNAQRVQIIEHLGSYIENQTGAMTQGIALEEEESYVEYEDSPLIRIPNRNYCTFVGRSKSLTQIKDALLSQDSTSIPAIVGLGGMGKTALAREVVEYILEKKIFEHIVWVSFKIESFISEKIISNESHSDRLSDVLSSVARQCGRLDIAKMPLARKSAALKHLLHNKRVLIVLDNLETLSDEVALVAALTQLTGRSRLLLTSRHQVKHEQVLNISLTGLSEDESMLFLRKNGEERNISAIAQASQSQLIEVYTATGGAPLAMKLVVGQMNRLPMTVILKTLRQASFKGQDYQFYRFIYKHSWSVLDFASHKLLVDLSVFPPRTGGSVLAVPDISQVEESAFWSAMDQLVTMSLVDKTGDISKERYSLHSLTQYFIRSDITKEW
ncbi:MAG: NB-ARC domain-containing protein [Cyanobacteria bacterium J06649_4]